MKKIILSVLFFVFITSVFAQKKLKYSVQRFSTLDYISVRAIEVVNDNTVWFAANNGVWGYTEDGGKNWIIDSIKVNNTRPAFRSIAVLNDSTTLLLSIGSPAYLFKTTNKGKIWHLVYTDTCKDIFFDCMKFSDNKNGYAIADPINLKLQLIKTNDAGNTWTKIEDIYLPILSEKEAFFASSNSNLDIVNNTIYLASGGSRSRVFRLSPQNKSDKIFDTPMPSGETMTGIYSLDYYNEKIGAIAGGHYDKKDSILTCLAITTDGGNNWKSIPVNKPLFGSCVQFKNNEELFLTGHSGSIMYNIRKNKTIYLKDHIGNDLKFHTLRISPSNKTIWFAGNKGQFARITL